MKKRIIFPMVVFAFLSTLFLALASLAQAQTMAPTMQPAATMQPMTMSSEQRAIVAEAWTLTPQRTAKTGFPGLPLRMCEGFYCGVLAKMPACTEVGVLVDDRQGWALVHVPSLNLYGWVNTPHIYY